MSRSIRIGYRRRPDGSAEPICEPPVDVFLLILWGRAAEVVLREPHYILTVSVDDPVAFEGSLSSRAMAGVLWEMAREVGEHMRAMTRLINDQYPFAFIARTVVEKARPRLLLNLDQPFVITEAPAFAENGRLEVEPPRIEEEDGRLRVVVTGNPEGHPLRAWGDCFIRDRAREEILEHLLRDTNADSF